MPKRSGYDYVIVGAGSAGCVLANRLSEDPDVSVVLIEAGGPDKDRRIHVPAAFSQLFKTAADWNYTTEPQPELGGRQLYWPRGKVYGGCSSINAMIYIRGHPTDYDRWEQLGNFGWGFRDVLPYFKRSEHQERGRSEFHEIGGPLNVADLGSPNLISRAFVDAALECGYPRSEDFNGYEQEGFGFYQTTIKDGRRCSAAGAFLKPALRRSNLSTRPQCLAQRIMFSGRKATGVVYLDLKSGKPKQVHAEREVILCGGAINSPQLLMLSGIGPAEHLQSLQIPITTDLPGVGQNLQDHLCTGISQKCTQPITLADAGSLTDLFKFLIFRTGPLTSNVAEAGGFVRTRPDAAVPDLQLLFAPAFFMEHGFQNPDGHGFSMGPTLIRPRSRGEISLRSADPLQPPIIQPNYCSEPNDMRLLLEGVKIARRIAASKSMQPFCGDEVWPGAESQSDEALIEHIRRTSETLYHPVGTCKMGTDAMAVVDPELRVRGVEQLRVVDASIMPEITGGNTNAPTIMIGEKAADLIRSGQPQAVASAT